MKTRATSVAIALAILASLAGATSSSAATSFPFYAIGGIVKWSGLESSKIAFDGPFSVYRPITVERSNTETTFRFGGGYSFDENWSIEASYVVGPTQETSFNQQFQAIDEFFPFDVKAKRDVTMLRAGAVYEIPFRKPVSFFAKAGLALVESKAKFSFHLSDDIRTLSIAPFPIPTSISNSSDDTKLFASAGIRFSFKDRRTSASLAFVRYDDLPQVDNAFELDLQWRF
ncbi:MAG: outer membrane beta-barrel protein [Gammaproteobacteria bacterium]|nr:outer membrane beta-barrel protein [Gammaproteobacteria bacterium]